MFLKGLISLKNKYVKVICSCVLFIVIIIMFWVIFKDVDINSLWQNIKRVNITYILVGILIMFLFSIGEALNIRLVLQNLGYRLSFGKYFKYAIVGFFFSSITPSSSGGQPLQIYAMKKDSILISHSIIALMVELFSFQFACFLWAIIGFFFLNSMIFEAVGSLKWIFLLGILINFIILLFLFIMLFSKKLFAKICSLLHKFLNFIHYKGADLFYEKALQEEKKYRESTLFLKENKIVLFKVILIAIGKIFLYHSIPYFVYRALGFSDFSIFHFVFVEAFLYCAVSFLPFPGAMGVSEGGFVLLFKMFFPEFLLSSAMLLSRSISLYFYLCITGLILFIIWFSKRIYLD